MADCQVLKNRLDSLTERRDAVEQELETTSDPSERATLIAWLNSLNRRIALVERQYNDCLHPPLPKPDLVAKTFQVRPHHDSQTMDIACVIQNDGDGPARGPFEVVLGVSYKNREGTQITRQLTIHVPNDVTIEGHGTQYITEAIPNIPLLYRDDNANFVYDFEMIVDATNQVSEVSESNNYVSFRYWTVRPSPAPGA